MKKKKHFVVVPGDGDPCPRCGKPTQIREHTAITGKQQNQPFYYRRWFCCMDVSCKTTLIMPKQHIVWNVSGERREKIETWLDSHIKAEPQVIWGDSWDDVERQTGG